MKLLQIAVAALALAFFPNASMAETCVWDGELSRNLSETSCDTVVFASTGTLYIDKVNNATITVSNGGNVRIKSPDYVPAALAYTAPGGTLYVETMMVFDSVMKVLEVAEGYTITITVGKFFTVVWPVVWPSTAADWRTTVTPLADACVWKGGAAGNFGNSSAWAKGNSGSAYASNTMTINNALVTNIVAMNVNAQSKLNGACFLYDVTLTMASDKYLIMLDNIQGPGKIVFMRDKVGTATSSAPVVLRKPGGSCKIYCDMEVAQTEENGDANQYETVRFEPYNGGAFHLYGAVSGMGKALMQDGGTNPGYTYIYGDMSCFSGDLEINLDKASTSFCRFMAPNTVGGRVLVTDNNDMALCDAAGTYVFNSLSGKVSGNANDVTIVTGGGDTQNQSIAYKKGAGLWTLEKRGDQQLTVTGEDFAHYTLNGGSLVTVEEQTIGSSISTSASGTITCSDASPWTYTFTPSAGGVTVDSDGITVPQTWLENHALAAATAEDLTATRPAGPQSNGYSYFACYALGLDPEDPDSTPKIAVSLGADGKYELNLAGCGTIPDGVAISLSVSSSDDNFASQSQEGTARAGVQQTFSINPADVEDVKYYRFNIHISAAQ